jgi:hypothetical protein
MGEVIEEKTGRKILTIETVINYKFPYRIAGIYAGSITKTHEQTLQHVFKQQNAPRKNNTIFWSTGYQTSARMRFMQKRIPC